MFVTGADVVKQLYSAPTPMRLERNQIEVDMTFDSVNVSLALLSIVSSSSKRLSPIQTARLLYMHGEGKWLVGSGLTNNCPEIVLLFGLGKTHEALISSLQEIEQDYGIRFNLEQSMQMNGSGIPPEWVAKLLSFSFECELVRSCGWVQVGKESNVLTIVEAVSVPKRSGEKETRNVQMISIGGNMNSPYHLRINSSINKYYPLDFSQVPCSTYASGVNVVVLPTFTEAVCVGHATVRDLPQEVNTFDSFKQYWWVHHGFRLSDESLNQLVKVRINDSFTLVYPLTCVWKLRPCLVPSYTKLYESSMESRIVSAIQWIRGLWQYMCGLQLRNIESTNKQRLEIEGGSVDAPSKRHRNA